MEQKNDTKISTVNWIEAQIKEDEGFSQEIYRCTAGELTFGWGHMMTPSDPETKQGKKEGDTVSMERCNEAFAADVAIATMDARAIFPDFDALPQMAQGVLINMAFNLGRPRLEKFVKLKAAIAARNFHEAANQMYSSRWYSQVGSRATRLVGQMRGLHHDGGKS